MPLHSSFPASVSTGGGGASLRTAYSQTAPATDGSVALWVKGDAPTGGEYLSALVEYGEISVENTQQSNSYSSFVCGGGVYNGALYFAQRVSTNNIDIKKIDLSTFQLSTFLSNAVIYPRVLFRGFVRDNKFYLLSTSTNSSFCIIDLDNGSSTQSPGNSFSSSYYWSIGINQSATTVHMVRRQTSGSGSSIYNDVYATAIDNPGLGARVYDMSASVEIADLYDDDDVLYVVNEPFTLYNSVGAIDIANQKYVSYNGGGNEVFWAVFKAGSNLYVIHGRQTCSISRLVYNGSSITTQLVASNLFSANYFSYYVDNPLSTYTSGYAVDGNVLWLYAFPSADTSSVAPIIKVTLDAGQYETDSIIISTTMQQKNLATIVKDDGVEIKVFVNEVLRKNGDGTTSSVEAYTLSSDGTWVRV